MTTETVSSILNEWKVTGLNVFPEFDGRQNVVVEVLCTLTSHDLFGGIRGTSGSFPVNPTIVRNFIPFAELTEDVILGWMPATMKSRIEANNAHGAINLTRSNEVELTPPAI